MRIERYQVADSYNRIQYRPLATGKCGRLIHRLGTGNSVSTANELHAIRFIRYFLDISTPHFHYVKHPERLFFNRTRSAGTKNRMLVSKNLRLNKKFTECRV